MAMKNATNALSRRFVVALLAFVSFGVAQAKLSPQWLDTQAFQPNVRLLIHESAVAADTPISFVAVQSPSSSEEKVVKLFAKMQVTQKPITDLAPHACYSLARTDLSSAQTWCKSVSGRIFIFVEKGLLRMSENELLDLELQTLSGAK